MSTAQPCVLGCTTAHAGLPRQAAPGRLACHECADELHKLLGEVERLYRGLDVTPGASGSARGAPGYGPRSPAVDDLIAHRDLRTQRDGASHAGALAVVESWARSIREDRSIDLPPDQVRATVPAGRVTMHRELGTLRFHWDWICGQPWVDEFAAEMRQLRGQLRTARREAEPVLQIGTCPNVIEIDDELDAACGERLHVRPGDREIRCRSCGTTWTRDRWRQLGSRWADYPTLAEQLGVPVGTLHRWRHEDGWKVSGSRSRRLVSRAEAIASYAKRRGLLEDGRHD